MSIWSSEIKELEKLYESFKGHMPELEKELEHLIKTDDAVVVLVYSRRSLELIVNELCETELNRQRKTEPLKGIIDKLNSENKVPEHIITSMLNLNSLSNYGAHPKDFDTEQVKLVLVNLHIILKWYLKCINNDTNKEKLKSKEYNQTNIKASGVIRLKKRKILLTIWISVLALIVLIGYKILIENSQRQIEKEAKKSVAVIPFTNLSSDKNQEYFSDGMVDAILDHLFKIGDIKVISRTSSMRYKNTKLSIKEIAHELGVSTILEGSVQKYGNNVRITAQLIDAETEFHLWSETYDRDISDIFSIQSEVAQNVARELKITLTNKETELVEKSHTRNLAAYNLYIQGRFFWSKRTPDGLQKSIAYFEQSISEDPYYALAYSGLADAYFIQTWWGWRQSPEGYKKAKEFVLKALEIDENNADAHATLGSLLMWNEWDWKNAQKEFNLAIELNPNCANAHQYYSEFYDIIGDWTNAHKQINLSLKIDPLSPVMNVLSGLYYYREGKFEESLKQYQKGLELNPEYRGIYVVYFNIYVKQREDQKAIYWLKKYIISDTVNVRDTSTINIIYKKRGAKGVFSWLIETGSGKSYLTLASHSANLGEKEKTLTFLEKAVENRESQIPRINSNPDFDFLRSEPRFQAIIKKMGLSEYAKKE